MKDGAFQLGGLNEAAELTSIWPLLNSLLNKIDWMPAYNLIVNLMANFLTDQLYIDLKVRNPDVSGDNIRKLYGAPPVKAEVTVPMKPEESSQCILLESFVADAKRPSKSVVSNCDKTFRGFFDYRSVIPKTPFEIDKPSSSSEKVNVNQVISGAFTLLLVSCVSFFGLFEKQCQRVGIEALNKAAHRGIGCGI